MWCGFDERMREGMQVYGFGVGRAISASATERQRTLAEQLEVETSELGVLGDIVDGRLATAESHSTPDRLRLAAFRGMISIAESLIADSGGFHSRSELVEAMGQCGARMGSMIESYESHYKRLPIAWSHAQRAAVALDTCLGEFSQAGPIPGTHVCEGTEVVR